MTKKKVGYLGNENLRKMLIEKRNWDFKNKHFCAFSSKTMTYNVQEIIIKIMVRVEFALYQRKDR